MTIGRRDAAASTPLARGQRGQSELAIVWRPIAALKPDQENPRSHTPKQIRRLAASIESLGFNHPILVDREFRVIAGHGRLLACQELDWAEVPTIVIDHLSETQRRAFMIADNRLAENAGWDDQVLARQLKHLCLTELDFSIEATGLEIAEVELRVASLDEASRDRANRASNRTGKRRKAGAKRPVCRDGEWWLFGHAPRPLRRRDRSCRLCDLDGRRARGRGRGEPKQRLRMRRPRAGRCDHPPLADIDRRRGASRGKQQIFRHAR